MTLISFTWLKVSRQKHSISPVSDSCDFVHAARQTQKSLVIATIVDARNSATVSRVNPNPLTACSNGKSSECQWETRGSNSRTQSDPRRSAHQFLHYCVWWWTFLEELRIAPNSLTEKDKRARSCNFSWCRRQRSSTGSTPRAGGLLVSFL